MDDQRAHVTDIRYVRMQLQSFDETLAGLQATDDLETQHTSAAQRRVLLRQGIPGARSQSGVVDGLDLITSLQPLRHGLRAIAMPLHTQAERLEALGEQERVERRGRGSQI